MPKVGKLHKLNASWIWWSLYSRNLKPSPVRNTTLMLSSWDNHAPSRHAPNKLALTTLHLRECRSSTYFFLNAFAPRPPRKKTTACLGGHPKNAGGWRPFAIVQPQSVHLALPRHTRVRDFYCIVAA